MALPFQLPRFDQYLPGYGMPLSIPRAKPPEPEEMTGPPLPTFDQLTPRQQAIINKRIELEDKPRSALGEISTALTRGTIVEAPRMIGQGLKALDKVVPGTDMFHKIGSAIVENALDLEPKYLRDTTPGAHNAVTDAIVSASESIPASVAATTAAVAAAPALGLGAAGTVALAGLAGGSLFAGATWQDSYEKAKKFGLSEEDARAVAHKEAAYEFGGETLGGAAFGKTLTTLGRLIPGKKNDLASGLNALRDPKELQDFAKATTFNAVVQTGTEMAQAAGQADVERTAGIGDATPWDAAKSAIGPAIAQTLMLGPFGAAGQHAQNRQNKQAFNTLAKPDATMMDIARASDTLEPQLEVLVGKEKASAWRLDLLANDARTRHAAAQEQFAQQQQADQQAAAAAQAQAAQAAQEAQAAERAARDAANAPMEWTGTPPPAPPNPNEIEYEEGLKVPPGPAPTPRPADPNDIPWEAPPPPPPPTITQRLGTKQGRTQWLKEQLPKAHTLRKSLLDLEPQDLADTLRRVWLERGGEAGKQAYLPQLEAAYREITGQDIRTEPFALTPSGEVAPATPEAAGTELTAQERAHRTRIQGDLFKGPFKMTQAHQKLLQERANQLAQELDNAEEADGGVQGTQGQGTGQTGGQGSATAVPQGQEATQEQVAPTPEVVGTFTTAKGSTYQLHADGTTTRDKAARPEHPGEQERGAQPRSGFTGFIDPADADKLSLLQATHPEKMALSVSTDGKHVGAMWTTGPNAGKLIRGSVVKLQEPGVGMLPLEGWRTAISGGTGKEFDNVHFGNKITKLEKKEAAPAPAVTPQAGTEASARVQQQNKVEADLRRESQWQRLMGGDAKVASEITPEDATEHLARLNAAPGDNPQARAVLERIAGASPPAAPAAPAAGPVAEPTAPPATPVTPEAAAPPVEAPAPVPEPPPPTPEPEPEKTASDEQVQAEVEKLPVAEQETLAEHYGEPIDSKGFLTKLAADIQAYVVKGAKAVDAAIRSIIKKLATGVLATSLVFNPAVFANQKQTLAYDLPAAITATSTKFTTEVTGEERTEIRANVPSRARAKMSDRAQRVYEAMAPQAMESGYGFFIADKPTGMMHVFHADGTLMAQSTALYGKDIGDVLVGNSLDGGQKITPAGTFTMVLAKDAEYAGGMIFGLKETNEAGGWIAVHAAWLGEPKEQRARRLASPSPEDNRISYGCINTTKEVFLNQLLPNSAELNGGPIFVLPDAVENTEAMFPAQTQVTPVTTTTMTTTQHTALPGNVTAVSEPEMTLPGRREELIGTQAPDASTVAGASPTPPTPLFTEAPTNAAAQPAAPTPAPAPAAQPEGKTKQDKARNRRKSKAKGGRKPVTADPDTAGEVAQEMATADATAAELAAKVTDPETGVILNAAPGGVAAEALSPTVSAPSVAAPEVVVVSPTGAESERPVAWNEYSTTAPDGTVTYNVPDFARAPALLSKYRSRGKPARYRAEVPVSERRKVHEDKLFGFEILNYDEKRARDVEVNAHWSNEYQRALKIASGKTAAAPNAIAALKWLNEYEGTDIVERALRRDLAGIMDVNDRFREIAAKEEAEIARHIKNEVLAIAFEQKRRIAAGMGIEDADRASFTELHAIHNALAKEELKQKKRNQYTIGQNKIETAEKRTKQEEARRKNNIDKGQAGQMLIEYVEEIRDKIMANDSRIINMHADTPNYVPTEGLLRATETGSVGAVLDELIANGPSSWVKEVAGTLRRLGLQTSIRTVNKIAYDANGQRLTARYDHDSNQVVVYVGGANAHTLIHEVAHGATVGRIRMAKAALAKPESERTGEEQGLIASLNDLRALITTLRERDTKNRYGLKSLQGNEFNEEEFVAETLANEKFQQWMHSQTFQDTRSLWRKFTDWVRELLMGQSYEDNAMARALSMSVSFLGDSRFAAGEGLSFNQSVTGAAAQVDMMASSVTRVWDHLTSNYKVLGHVAPKLRQAAWYTSTLFNIAKFVEKVPALRTLVPGVDAFMKTNGIKTIMRQQMLQDLGQVTTEMRMALGKYTRGSERAAKHEKVGEFVAATTSLNIDLNKNFDENKRANPDLDDANRAYVNQLHGEYRAFPAALKKPMEDSFRTFRKGYIQYNAIALRDTLGMYLSTSPQLSEYMHKLDIRNPALSQGTNPRPGYYRDAYTANLDQAIRGVLRDVRGLSIGSDNLMAAIAEINKYYLAAVANPYMHLGRSGDYFMEFNVADTEGAWGQVQAILPRFGKIIGAPTARRHVFLRFETPSQRDAAKKAMEQVGVPLVPDTLKAGSLFNSADMTNLQGVSAFARKLKAEADTEETKAFIQRIYVDMHPDDSIHKMMAQRRDGGVPGSDNDFLKNYVKRAEAMVTSVSNAYVMPAYHESFGMMKQSLAILESGPDAGAADKANEVFKELSRRFSNSLSPVDSTLLDTTKSFGYNFFQALSPAVWLVNMSQSYHLGLPVLGGRYGYMKSFNEMKRSSVKSVALIKAAAQSGWTQGMDIGGFYGGLMGALDLTLPLDQGGLTPGEREFVRQLIDSGQLDTTQSQELARMASSQAMVRSTASKVLSVGSHYTEVFNRLNVALAGYNLSMRKDQENGVSIEQATKNATARGIETVRATQFDHSDNNVSRLSGRHGIFKKATPLLFQFQQHSFQTLELLLRLTVESFQGTQEEKNIARKSLAGVLGATAVLAGSLGLPGVTVIAALIDALFSDDDDPLDVKSAYRIWLAEVLGNDAAEAVARGIPRAVFGIDTAGRVGMQDIVPFTRFLADRRSLKDRIETGVFSGLGPAVSAGQSVMLGAGKMLDGQIMDGLIEMSPVALKGPAKAFKMEEVGYTTKTGVQLPLEVTTWDSLVQAVGFTPSEKAEHSEVTFSFRQREMLLKQRKAALANQFYRAKEAGEDTTAALQEVMAFNNANPEYRIDVAAGLQARAKARATAVTSDSGIATLPRFLPTLDRYSYANTR